MTSPAPRHERLRIPAFLALATVAAACAPEPSPVDGLLPLPADLAVQARDTFLVSAATPVVVDAGDAGAREIAGFLSELVGNRVEERPPVLEVGDSTPERVIRLSRLDAPEDLGEEGYGLRVTSDSVVVRAPTHAGLFYGVQTLRQLLPPAVEYTAAFPRPLPLPGIRVTDRPRYRWRGAMLDVARHFIPGDDVRRFIDLMALHKLNRLHLHLTDDQGWRIEIPGWPELTRIGGSTEVGGGPGGFYTSEEYRGLVAYARSRFITVVPEIDMPGHIHAALASYPALNCDGEPRDLYTGTEVGFSQLCLEKDLTWDFVGDVIAAVAGMTPGDWLHVGGDEVPGLPEDDYADFMGRVQGLVRETGKTLVAWDEIAGDLPAPGTVVQLWRPRAWAGPGGFAPDTAVARVGAEQRQAAFDAQDAGARFIVSPANRLYLDMKAHPEQVLGLRWAGTPDLRDSYDWDPSIQMAGLREDAILGVEGPIWTETAGTLADVEYLAFPRLAAVAELGWTPLDRRSWDDFRRRVGAQSARWTALGIRFRRSPLVPWDVGPPDP